jgi:lysozyme
MKNIIKKCSIAVIVALGISLAPGSVRTSKEGQQKIAGWEDCRSTPYYCTAGVLTVGIGSTGGVENREYSNQEIARRLTICNGLKTASITISTVPTCRSSPLRP